MNRDSEERSLKIQFVPRQHSSTELTELVGKVCYKILVVRSPDDVEEIVIFYMKVGECWFRMFLDASLLFANEVDGPDPEDDLDEGCNYEDLTEKLGLHGLVIRSAAMKDEKFKLHFVHGQQIEFDRKGDDRTLLRVVSM